MLTYDLMLVWCYLEESSHVIGTPGVGGVVLLPHEVIIPQLDGTRLNQLRG